MTDIRRKRIVYMSDQEWEATKAHAAKRRESVSSLVRQALRFEPETKAQTTVTIARPSEPFIAAPVVEWRPVPKPSKAKR